MRVLKLTNAIFSWLSERLRGKMIAKRFAHKILSLTVGAAFVSKTGKSVRRLFNRRFASKDAPEFRVAIIAHVYYIDLLDEILECQSNIKLNVDVHLTVPREKLFELEEMVSGNLTVTLHPCVNRGRDIAPFLSVMQSGALDHYDAVLKLHTKRSPHLLDGSIRRKLLFAMLCGEPHATASILTAFQDPATGMVGWSGCYRTKPGYWMGNEERVRGIASKMDAGAAARLGFFEGSMFWFRPSAFVALRELNLSPDDFEPEAKQLDGTLHHAIERCFTIAARARGFIVRDLNGRPLP